MEQINAVGRRKAAIARVFVKEGTGVITINNRALENYFPNPILQYIVKQPLTLLDVLEKYDIKVNLVGGGYTGQAEALRLGIARALVKINPEDKPALRQAGFVNLFCYFRRYKCLVSKLSRLLLPRGGKATWQLI